MNKAVVITLLIILTACTGRPDIESWQTVSEQDLLQLADKDKDGVIAARDKCLQTQSGLFTDAGGCATGEDKEIYSEAIVRFSANSVQLNNESRNQFIEFMDQLDSNLDWNFLLQGYTTEEGDLLYNKITVKRRMASVSDFIREYMGTELNAINLRLLDGDKVAEEASVTKMQKDLINDIDHDGIANVFDKCPGSNYKYRVDFHGCTVYETRLVKHQLTVRYPKNKAEIADVYRPKILELAAFIKKYNVQKVNVYGYTSMMGTPEYNQDLSERRAQSVVDMLIQDYGINPDVLQPIGKGETGFIDASMTQEAHRLNRRVQITLSEELNIEMRRDLGTFDTSELTRQVVVWAQSTKTEYKNRWHIFIMETEPTHDDYETSILEQWSDVEYDTEDAESLGW